MEFRGQQDRFADNTEFNSISFIAKQLIALIKTATVVQVLSCTNDGGVSPVGFVDVQPLVNQLDGAGQPVSYPPVYNVPYHRVQGGTNAIIIDPQPGDIGIAVIADRDINTVKNTRAQGNPGSFRKFDIADAIYIGGILNAEPQNYVRFDGASNIIITATGNITTNSVNATVNASSNAVINAGAQAHVTAPQCVVDATTTINGNTTINGSLVVRDGVKAPSYAGLTAGTGTMTVHQATIDTATVAGKLVDTHTHTDPQGGTTGPMQ